MRLSLAGAAGLIGRPLTAQLLAGKHKVVAMLARPTPRRSLRDLSHVRPTGTSNANAKIAFDWSPQYATWRSEFEKSRPSH